MSHFERTEGGPDNLGNNPEFIPLENLAVDGNDRPDEALMRKEEEFSEDATPLIDLDEEPSNWEADVEAGKYDNGYINNAEEVTINEEDTIKISPIHMQNRHNIVAIGDMDHKERHAKFEHVPPPNFDNSKPKQKEIERDSIRFDEAV